MSRTSISFPPELVEVFVGAAWSMPLSADDRISLMLSLSLVNSTWKCAYTRVSSKDVHIPCTSYWDHYFSILRRECPFYSKETQALVESRCRSVTFTIEHVPSPQQGPTINLSTAKAMSDMLYFVSDDQSPFLPNLRKVAIHYHNMSFDDIFENFRLVDFPSQVNTLEIIHTFSSNTPSFLVSAMRDKPGNHLSLSWRMPHIHHLTLAGVGSDYVADMVAVCPKLRVLEVGLAPDTAIYTYVPEPIKRLILHIPRDTDLSSHKLNYANSFTLRVPSSRRHSRWIYLQPCKAYKFLSLEEMAYNQYTITISYPSR
ncbi:hypothetical protein AX15_004234 [Amanita polypyramis BW_CC]|nr:hypothetical protein AX15_004234 [Amanita polypyramis BW_CC]